MGYLYEDFGDAFTAVTKGFSDYSSFFMGNWTVSDSMHLPQLLDAAPRTFLSHSYRPLWLVLVHLKGLIGLAAPYAALVFSGILHLIAIWIFLNLLTPYTNGVLAGLLTSLFAFHPRLGFWFGRLSTIPYLYGFLGIAALVRLLKQYLDTREIRYYWFSVAMFAATLLVRETLMMFPVWLTGAVWWYSSRYATKVKVLKWYDVFKLMLPFYLLAFLHVEWRLHLFPLTYEIFGGGEGFVSAVVSTAGRLIEYFLSLVSSKPWQSFLADTLWLSAIPVENIFLKISFLAAAVGSVVYLYGLSRHKQEIQVCIAAYLTLSWPSLIFKHTYPYLYESYGFFVIALAFLIIPLYGVKKHKKMFYTMIAVLGCMVFIGVGRGYKLMSEREHVTSIVRDAFTELGADSRIHKRNICFMGVPAHYFPPTAIDAAVKLHLNKYKPRAVFHSAELCYQDEASVWKEGIVKAQTAPKISKNWNVYVLEHESIEDSWVHSDNTQGEPTKFAFGNLIPERYYRDKIDRARIILNQHSRVTNPLIVTWDDSRERFSIIN
jgi:hypothetical protein